MGNIRSKKAKKTARELLKRYPDKFTADFEENKKLVTSLISTPSKNLRNTIVGYITRVIVRSQSTEKQRN